MQYGLLGEKLGHSFSPIIHSHFGNYSYHLIEVAPENLAEFLLNREFDGLNVTMPYKKLVLPYCSKLGNCAQVTGAVNTIVKQADGSLAGYNTDYYGFNSMLAKSGLRVVGKKVLVLGNGGASASVTAVLKDCGALPVVISRTGKNNYNNIDLHLDAAVIVNTTPVGMYPNTGHSPLCLDAFASLEGALDIIYNPTKTKLIQDAEKRGLTALNGLWMLVAQAKQSAELFLGINLPDIHIDSAYAAIRAQVENCILIGMPGCGKTTIGRHLARITGKRFIDTDDLIVRRAGKTIPEIFKEHGEAYFRALETAVLKEVAKESGFVIATGGGCVIRKENYDYLHQNGQIIWLQRDINILPTDGRPLSNATTLQELYAVREPHYHYFSDLIVRNDATPEETASKIARWRYLSENPCD